MNIFNLSSIIILIFLTIFSIVIIITLLKGFIKCPPNKVLIIYGISAASGKSYKIYSGKTVFVIPIIQRYEFLDLNPIKIPIDIELALDKNNNRVNFSCIFSVKISIESNVIDNAVERLTGLAENELIAISSDIIFGEMRVLISQSEEQDIKDNPEKFFSEIYKNINPELNKSGIQIDNVNLPKKTFR